MKEEHWLKTIFNTLNSICIKLDNLANLTIKISTSFTQKWKEKKNQFAHHNLLWGYQSVFSSLSEDLKQSSFYPLRAVNHSSFYLSEAVNLSFASLCSVSMKYNRFGFHIPYRCRSHGGWKEDWFRSHDRQKEEEKIQKK